MAQLGSDLLRFRKALVPARSALHDLATRRSLFISETTQRFLANLVGSVDRLLEDVLADRDSCRMRSICTCRSSRIAAIAS